MTRPDDKDGPMPRPTTGAAYLALILTLLGGVVFIVFLLIPAYSTWRGEQLRLEVSMDRKQEQQTFLENIDARTVELKALDRDVRALQVLFPDTIATPELATIMHGLASRNGVAITQMTRQGPRKVLREPAEAPRAVASTQTTARDAGRSDTQSQARSASASPQPKDESALYEFGVSLRGSYAQVRAFMADLERSLRFFNLQTVALSSEQGDRALAAPISAQLSIWTYLTVEP